MQAFRELDSKDLNQDQGPKERVCLGDKSPYLCASLHSLNREALVTINLFIRLCKRFSSGSYDSKCLVR